MRHFYTFLFVVGFVFFVEPVFGQVEGDTLGLTGTNRDTLVARQLLNDALKFINIRKYEDAYSYADSAETIYTRTLGSESIEVAEVLHQKGRSFGNSGQYDRAIGYFQKSLEIRLKILGKEHIDVATSYNNLGNSFGLKGDYEKSIENHQRSLDIRLKVLGAEHLDVASSYTNLAVTYKLKGEFAKATEYQQIAIDIRLKILGNNHLDMAYSYNELGNIFGLNHEFNKAVKCHQKALEIRFNKYGIEHPDVASSYFNLALSFNGKEEYEKAIEYYQKSLEIRLKTLGTSNLKVANSYNNLGNSFQSTGDYDRSIDCYRKALDIRLKILGEDNLDVANSYGSISGSLWYKGEYDKAIYFCKKSLQIQYIKLGSEHPVLATSFNNLGAFYYAIGENEKAIEYYQKALDIRLKVLEPKHPDVAQSFNNLGNCFRGTDKAIEYYQKSLEIELVTPGTHNVNSAHVYDNLGGYYHSIGEHKKSIEYFQKGLDIRLQILGDVHPDVALTYNNMGQVYNTLEKIEMAKTAYSNALIASQYQKFNFLEVNSMERLIDALVGMGKTLQLEYHRTHKTNLISQAYDIVEQNIAALAYQRMTFSDESSKSFWQTQNYPIYEQTIAVSLLKADVDHNDTLRQNTFTYAEKSKASLLQAQIKSTDAINFSSIPDSLLQQEHDLRINLTWREKQCQTLLNQGLTETDTNTLRISSIIFDLRRDYEALKQRFETDYPAYYRLKYDLNTVSLQYVQDTLLQPKNQALLEYFVGDSSIYLFVVRPDTMIVQEVKRDFPLEDWIEQLRQGLYGYYTADQGKRTTALYNSTQKQYIEYGQKLYQKLVAPVQPWLLEQVIVVPDGPLGYVPFDALLTSTPPPDSNDFKSYPYLLNKYQFSYTYSATLLKEMCDKKHHRTPTKKFAAFAPFYTGDTSLLANMYAYDDLMRKDLQTLVYSGQEVAAASKLMNGEIIAGTAATEERFTSTAGDYRILHLATHGRADNRVGDYAFLAFTEIKDSIENELLYVKDLYNLELNADLVVLSACETGIGKLQRGEGIISLARAFAYAGAKSIVTTLWEVNDKSTSELMRYFYRELRKGKPKDEALRSARKAYLEKSKARTCHPFFWAAFVPIGDMRAVK